MKEKCAEIIQRLSSRANHSAMNENCNSMRPFCIDKSYVCRLNLFLSDYLFGFRFYQHMNDVGHDRCVEVCDKTCYPMFSKVDRRFCNSNQFVDKFLQLLIKKRRKKKLSFYF